MPQSWHLLRWRLSHQPWTQRVKTGLHLPDTTAPGNTKDFPSLSTSSLICQLRHLSCLMWDRTSSNSSVKHFKLNSWKVLQPPGMLSHKSWTAAKYYFNETSEEWRSYTERLSRWCSFLSLLRQCPSKPQPQPQRRWPRACSAVEGASGETGAAQCVAPSFAKANELPKVDVVLWEPQNKAARKM